MSQCVRSRLFGCITGWRKLLLNTLLQVWSRGTTVVPSCYPRTQRITERWSTSTSGTIISMNFWRMALSLSNMSPHLTTLLTYLQSLFLATTITVFWLLSTFTKTSLWTWGSIQSRAPGSPSLPFLPHSTWSFFIPYSISIYLLVSPCDRWLPLLPFYISFRDVHIFVKRIFHVFALPSFFNDIQIRFID